MKHTGYILFLIGCGGLAESYDKPIQTIISLILAIVGCLILFHEVKNEKVHNHRNVDNVNILSRLRYLPR